ncbi:MAG: VOC family protein [Anaerolineales bacterium]|nr:VOC family protein [Anaerolineales bacterium]
MLLEGNLKGIQHLGIAVVDIAATKTWYVDTLGFELIHEPQLRTGEGLIFIAFLKRGDLVLELFQPARDSLEEVRNRTHGHIDHFALDVLCITTALVDLLSQGAELDPATPIGPVDIPQFWPKGVCYFFLTSVNGEKVELNQRMDLDARRRSENINGWSHLGIPVTNLTRTEEFYERFGFRRVMQAAVPAGREEIKVSMLEYNGFILEFYQLLPPDLFEIHSRNDGLIDHFALGVADIEQAFAELTAAGLQTLEAAPLELPFWENGAKYFCIRGPDGEKIEFNQIL